ncbi:MAG: hypothetical protein H6R15_192 [Proteobacteria bacterium]|nr:hypothetical protein [Pseudomonadota bacterium]
MIYFRFVSFFCCFLFSSFVFAESISAVIQIGVPVSEPPYNQATFEPLSFGVIYQNGSTLYRKEWAGADCPVAPVGWIGVAGYYSKAGGPCGTWMGYQKNQSLSCPENAGWTLSGDTCTRPDCRSDQVRSESGLFCTCPAGKIDSGGKCVADCPAGYHAGGIDMALCLKDCFGNQIQQADGSCRCNPGSAGVFESAFSAGGSVCNNGCDTKLKNPAVCSPIGVGKALAGALQSGDVRCYSYGTYSGEICGSKENPLIPVSLKPYQSPPGDSSGTGADGATPDPQNKPENNKDPVGCGNSGGSYIVINGAGKCLTSTGDNSMPKLNTSEKSSTSTNPDGSTSTTTEKTTTISDSKTGETATSKTSTTVTKDAAGNVTGTSTAVSGSSGTGDKSGNEPGQCAKEPDSPPCRKGQVTSEKGHFANRDEDLKQAKQDLKDKFSAIQSEITSMFTDIGSGGGSLPCPPGVEVLGKTFQICASKYSEQLSVIGLVLYFAAALGALFIILKR